MTSDAVRAALAEAREAIARAAARKAARAAPPRDRPPAETDALSYEQLYSQPPVPGAAE